MITLEEFRGQRSTLKGSPVRDKAGLIIQIANCFLGPSPSDIDDAFVLETDSFLNELHSDAKDNPLLQENVNNILKYSSYMCYFIKYNLPRTPDYFSTPKTLGNMLLFLGKNPD